jgi:hypothetical protein
VYQGTSLSLVTNKENKMKIQGGNPFSILGAYLKGAKEARKGEETVSSASPPVSDRVEISGKSQEIARLSKIVSKGSDVREDKVFDALRSFEAGKRLPSAKVLAESLIKATLLDRIL